MNIMPENIVVNSCEYTPVYLIPSTSVVNQAGSYLISQSNQVEQKPVADNLKTFYESSGNLDTNPLTNSKPRILKKSSNNAIGNNLKLASFLLPKPTVSDGQPKSFITPVNSVSPILVKSVTPIGTLTPVTPVSNGDTKPRVEMDRKIVPVGHIPNIQNIRPRVLPKKKPNEMINQTSKNSSVQLLKLGETYHSLNQLSSNQIKIVNNALKMFSDPEKAVKKPVYDPVTNTKFIYKVVSTKDLAVVGKNKVGVPKKKEIKKQKLVLSVQPETTTEPKVTRSGRTVKLPKQIQPNDSPQRRKKKVESVLNCFQCSAEFCSFYRLQRHYEMHPTHIPARIHSNLFHCLMAIIEGGSAEDQANMLIQQLEQLIEKLKSLLPCLLKKIDGEEGQLCTINEDIGRLFGMNSGKYNFNMEALNCVKDKEGYCVHNPPPKNKLFSSDVSKPSQLWLSKHNKEMADNQADTEDCARINSANKWPTVSKRIWKLKQQNLNAKKMRLENEQLDMDLDDVVNFDESDGKETQNVTLPKGEESLIELNTIKDGCEGTAIPQKSTVEGKCVNVDELNKTSKSHVQFHSTHFDIRSSPIKLPSSLVKKFQINLDKLSNYDVQVMQPIALNSDQNGIHTDNNLHDIINDVAQSKDNETNSEWSFSNAKWELSSSTEPSDSILKSNILFETPVKKDSIEPSLIHIDKNNKLFEIPRSKDLTDENILQETNKSNKLIDYSLIQENIKDHDLFGSLKLDNDKGCNYRYEEALKLIKPHSNSSVESSMIDAKSKTFESALLHVKERSNNLFETPLLHPRNNFSEPIPLMQGKHDSKTYLADVKEGSDLFATNLINVKDKDEAIIDPTLLLKDDSGLFSRMSQRQESSLLESTLIYDDKSTDLGEQSLMDMKLDCQTPIKLNEHNGISTNDNNLLINQSPSVLNFLDSLSNEPIALSYPETEIRNNAVDFQLDLFSFNST